MMTVLSLGAGVQSSTLALMAAKGLIDPSPSCAIFADTKGEPVAVYEWLEWLRLQLPFPVYTVTKGDLWKSASTVRKTRDGLRSYISTGIPVFTVDGIKKGMGKRQCTRTFKIEPVIKKCRELLGVTRIPSKSPPLVNMLMGISTDEADRMKPAAKKWINARFPLIDLGMSRTDCIQWCRDNGYPEPPKSACTYCPFHDDAMWLSMSDQEIGEVSKKEYELQRAYQDASALHSVPYFHAARLPLSEVIAQLRAKTMEPGIGQVDLLGNECEGMCGV